MHVLGIVVKQVEILDSMKRNIITVYSLPPVRIEVGFIYPLLHFLVAHSVKF